jgi:tetratricopeptide (TPR) repeat protein
MVAMRRLTILLTVLVLTIGGLRAVATETANDCDSPDSERRIRACSELIEAPDTAPPRRATAYANRALAYSLQGKYETAIRDYDQAIRLFPEFAVALNNRAWAYFKWGRASQGMPDVEKSLRIDPMSPHSLDTRAHIHQALGNAPMAMRDYQSAMLFGGARMVTLYQCGLKMHRLYDGPTDGIVTARLLQSMQACIDKGGGCDPLPPDEECRDATS